MITLYDKKNNCFGCGACAASCPQHAIAMERDEEGFRYPVVSEQMCTECGKCIKICPSYNEPATMPEAAYYGFQTKDMAVLRQSASGGAFTALSQLYFDACEQRNSVHKSPEDGNKTDICSKPVYVYGAALEEDGGVRHRAVEKTEDLYLLRNSKYVESDLGHCYTEIIKHLQQGNYVLFSGTPCQVQGLLQALKQLPDEKRWREQLLLVDIICNGVGSPFVWDCYRKDIEQTEGQSIKDYTFRDKRAPRGHAVSWRMKDGSEKIQPLFSECYAAMYFGGLISRPSCHTCPYARIERYSDVTIGDFHGQKDIENEFVIAAGVSLVIANTEKGREFCALLNKIGTLKRYPKAEVLQPRLTKPAPVHPLRKLFLKDMKALPFGQMMKKYGAMLKIKEINVS